MINMIADKPTLRVIGDADIRMGPGSRAQLRCVAHANPPPTFTWYKGNVTLTNDIVSAERNSLLSFQSDGNSPSFNEINSSAKGKVLKHYTVDFRPMGISLLVMKSYNAKLMFFRCNIYKQLKLRVT